MGLFDFLQGYIDKGIQKIICTDIDRDGMLNGPSVKTYIEILRRFPGVYLIASGGVAGAGDLEELAENGIPAAIVGKAIYEGRITGQEIRTFLTN